MKNRLRMQLGEMPDGTVFTDGGSCRYFKDGPDVLIEGFLPRYPIGFSRWREEDEYDVVSLPKEGAE